MFMLKIFFQGLLIAAVICCGLNSVAAPPVTSGLFVNLNADSVSNFTLNGSNVGVWNDLATDGTDGTVQSYGMAAAANQPLFTTALMPSGNIMNVVDFTRGTPTNNTRSSTPNSDFLVSNAGGLSTGFAVGADPAYVLGGTEQADGMSYVAVFHTDLATTPQATAQQRQIIWTSRYADPVSGPPGPGTIPQIYTHEDNSVGPESLVPDLLIAARQDGSNTADPYSQVNSFYGDISTSIWYIAAASWNLDSGDAVMRVRKSDGTDTGNVLNTTNASWATPFTNHQFAILGQSVNAAGNSSNQAIDGQIAELLVYNKALSNAEMDQLFVYLDNKYFAPVAVPGDYNGDGKVNGADYVHWRKSPSDVVGDPAGYINWRTKFGTGEGAGSGLNSPTVPEPATAAPCCVCDNDLLVLFPSAAQRQDRLAF